MGAQAERVSVLHTCFEHAYSERAVRPSSLLIGRLNLKFKVQGWDVQVGIFFAVEGVERWWEHVMEIGLDCTAVAVYLAACTYVADTSSGVRHIHATLRFIGFKNIGAASVLSSCVSLKNVGVRRFRLSATQEGKHERHDYDYRFMVRHAAARREFHHRLPCSRTRDSRPFISLRTFVFLQCRLQRNGNESRTLLRYGFIDGRLQWDVLVVVILQHAVKLVSEFPDCRKRSIVHRYRLDGCLFHEGVLVEDSQRAISSAMVLRRIANRLDGCCRWWR